MASSKKNISNQKKHEILADFIKKVHSTLRKNVRKGWKIKILILSCFKISLIKCLFSVTLPITILNIWHPDPIIFYGILFQVVGYLGAEALAKATAFLFLDQSIFH